MCNNTGNPANSSSSSMLLVLATCNDLAAFRRAVEVGGEDIAASAWWFDRPNVAERTPLMVASFYGSIDIVIYIVTTTRQQIDVNQHSRSDCVTALHMAVSGGSVSSLDIVKILIYAGADFNATDHFGHRPVDMIGGGPMTTTALSTKMIEYINNDIYGTDEFRIYKFKVTPCSITYSHDWTNCPFLHPRESARRRDPKKYSYSSTLCDEFRKKKNCSRGDACQEAHGIFECWLHPQRYRTQLCKDLLRCERKVCFFAHNNDELRRPAQNGLLLSATASWILPVASYRLMNQQAMFGDFQPIDCEPLCHAYQQMHLAFDKSSVDQKKPSLFVNEEAEPDITWVQSLLSSESMSFDELDISWIDSLLSGV